MKGKNRFVTDSLRDYNSFYRSRDVDRSKLNFLKRHNATVSSVCVCGKQAAIGKSPELKSIVGPLMSESYTKISPLYFCPYPLPW